MNKPSLLGLLRRYQSLILGLVVFTIVANALNLIVPRLIAGGIDSYVAGNFALQSFLVKFSLVALFVFLFTYLQSVVQVYASEKVARDLRNELVAKISEQPTTFVDRVGPAKLLTNLTADIDAIKTYVSQAVSTLISSLFLIIGASVLLLVTNWKLGLAVLVVIPIIGLTFATVLKKVRKLFKKTQEAIDWLNAVINESILGAALVKVLHAESYEYKKFVAANEESRNIGIKILRNFAGLIPVITLLTNFATLIILTLGGHFVIQGSMSIGDFSAFNSYLIILIFPIFLMGFTTNLIAQATASYGRIGEVLAAPNETKSGELKADLTGTIKLNNVSLRFGEKAVLNNVSFAVKPGTKTAIIGPTAAGKTQLLYALTGLIYPSEGEVLYDNMTITGYERKSFYEQIGLVFQDSVLFNLSLRENVAFSSTVKDEDIRLAIETAELQSFVESLPQGLDTIVSERGTTLSGGQKQRVMLARALALNPRILFLDDFTARVDNETERKILANIEKNYPDLTLISVTQKISSVEHYDQIILLMEGEVLATGDHEKLLDTSPEYVQIYESQKSTNQYELQA
jgi:ATP-binding cassette subfamily B protein